MDYSESISSRFCVCHQWIAQFGRNSRTTATTLTNAIISISIIDAETEYDTICRVCFAAVPNEFKAVPAGGNPAG